MTESIRQSFYGTGGFLLTAHPRELCHSALNPLANQREDTPSTMALLDRDVVLKALPAAVLAAPDWLARFEREPQRVGGSGRYGAGASMTSTSNRSVPVLRMPCGAPSGATSKTPACMGTSSPSSKNSPRPSMTW